MWWFGALYRLLSVRSFSSFCQIFFFLNIFDVRTTGGTCLQLFLFFFCIFAFCFLIDCRFFLSTDLVADCINYLILEYYLFVKSWCKYISYNRVYTLVYKNHCQLLLKEYVYNIHIPRQHMSQVYSILFQNVNWWSIIGKLINNSIHVPIE